MNIYIISDCLEQDSNAVIRSFEHIRQHQVFKRFEQNKKYIKWSDCGKTKNKR